MRDAIDSLLPLERDLFFALNGSDSQFLDNAMWTLSGRFIWIPLFLFILFIFFYKTSRKGAFIVALFFILLFVLSDQISSSLFKPFFERFRPTHHPDFTDLVDTVNNYRGGRYGFISGHATNSFGLAVFVSMVFKHRAVTAITLLWALLNSYTRVYLGVHFVSDIVAGIVVGSLVALLVYEAYSWARARVVHPSPVQTRSLYTKYGALFAITLVVYLAVITIFSSLLATLPH